ncbi:MAG: cbb3-type cytochrome c oxidase subunit I [Magnetococcales bacterium]|nr:cbb3-type cytochrome c oxidase subunit I [Magnetococcales bacterium]
MRSTHTLFSTLNGPSRQIALGWLGLALASMVGAGLVVILIVLARMPIIHDMIPWVGSFKTALVIHVDLSVLVWFLAFAGVIAAFTMREGVSPPARMGIKLAWLGTVLITFSPFLGAGTPYMNNYIPVLENQAFFAGIILFSIGFLPTGLLGTLSARHADLAYDKALILGSRIAQALALLAILFVIWSGFTLPGDVSGEYQYEILFWGGGHILQFTHTHLVSVVWLSLALFGGLRVMGSGRAITFTFIIGALPILAAPVIQILFPLDTVSYRDGFTEMMRWGNGITPLIIGLMLLPGLLANPTDDAQSQIARTTLRLSLLLFLAGGVIGFMIRGINVTIPAHYHGSIIAITLCYMGFTYLLLPMLGRGTVSPIWARRQLWIYVLGQLIHIFGLAWSGGHDVQRKTVGAAQELDTLQAKLPMMVTGIGAGIAIIAGIMFLVLAIRAFRQKQT